MTSVHGSQWAKPREHRPDSRPSIASVLLRLPVRRDVDVSSEVLRWFRLRPNVVGRSRFPRKGRPRKGEGGKPATP